MTPQLSAETEAYPDVTPEKSTRLIVQLTTFLLLACALCLIPSEALALINNR